MGSAIQKLMEGGEQRGDHISLLLFFKLYGVTFVQARLSVTYGAELFSLPESQKLFPFFSINIHSIEKCFK
jgi:hypothetical protein